MANFPFGSNIAQIDDNPDPGLPLVILLHGLGGDVRDMTNPAASVQAGFAFNRAATFSPYTDRGFNFTPPPLPISGFFIDPLTTSLTSWRSALNGAGLSTAAYSQSGSTIAADVAELTALATGPLSTGPYAGLRIALVGHSRGGVLARAFLTSARTNPALAAFLPRVTSCITLHSPHLGSGLVNAALGVDALVARVQGAFAAMGIPSPAPLASIRAFTTNPTRAELAIGSGVLAAIAAGEPLPGVGYHTFGGTSTVFARVWANVFTPDSALPLPFFPFPFFHHGTTPIPIAVPLDVRSVIPQAVLFPTPVMLELVTAATLLAASTPEVAPGFGDILVAAGRAHLPFSATSINNPLNHAEALWDPTLQGQVITILSRLRIPTVRPTAVVGITPYPASVSRATHVVSATDAATGATITNGSVVVRGLGGVLLRTGLGAPFPFAFRARRVVVFDDGRRTVELIYPSVSVELGAPYNTTVEVDIGLG